MLSIEKRCDKNFLRKKKGLSRTVASSAFRSITWYRGVLDFRSTPRLDSTMDDGAENDGSGYFYESLGFVPYFVSGL